MTDHHTFTSTIRFCGLFKPLRVPVPEIVRYGCSVNADDVPADLQCHVVRKPISDRHVRDRPDLAGSVWCHIHQPRPPRLVLTDGMDAVDQMRRLVDMAEACNITPDRLMDEIPATLAVRVIEWIDAATPSHPAQQSKRLYILAVRFAYDDLVRRFDELQREFFA